MPSSKIIFCAGTQFTNYMYYYSISLCKKIMKILKALGVLKIIVQRISLS